MSNSVVDEQPAMTITEILDVRYKKPREAPERWEEPRRPPQSILGEQDMTIGIVATSRVAGESYIVAVSDLMLSNDVVSFDTNTVKCEPITKNGKWIALYAGSPSVWQAVGLRARAAIWDHDGPPAVVQDAYEGAFQAEVKRQIDGRILSPYGLDRERFITSGREYFGEDEFARILSHVRAVALETEFLIAGFDDSGWPHIFSVGDPGVVERHNNIRFHAVGTGSVIAESILAGTFDSQLPLSSLVYRLCEAKFRAEVAAGVGRKTFVLIIAANRARLVFHPEHVEELRTIWQAEGCLPPPAKAIDKIGERLRGWASA